MASASAFPLAPWAYNGTDTTTGVQLFPFSSANSLPALVVWLILATNPSLAQTLTSADPTVAAVKKGLIVQISTAVNLTAVCVTTILNQFVSGTNSGADAATVSDAFGTVSDSFHSIGGPGYYPPDECPYLHDILTLAGGLNNFTPTTVA